MKFPSLHGKTVLVTGANGFTGGALVRALLAQGCHVRAFVRQPNAAPWLAASAAQLVAGDIRDRRAVDDAVAGCDQVYHLAALYRDASAPRQAYWEVNVAGTEHVLDACARHGVSRLIHCSTMGIHGGVSKIPSDETAPYQPGDEYQRAKLAAEERVWAWYRKTHLPTTVVRPAGIYGPGDLRFLKLFRGVQKGYFTILGSGRTWFHPVYIDDLIDGFLHCGTESKAIGEAFCISSSRSVTLNELVQLIADAVGVHAPRWHLPVWPFYLAGALCELVCVPLGINPPIYRRRVEFFTHNRAWASEKARQLLGYAWQVDHEEGFRRTAQWYSAHGYLRLPLGDVSHQTSARRS